MDKVWNERKKSKEESYFEQKNREAIQRIALQKREKVRLSPVTGEPLEQVVIHGVVVDRCPKSGGIWLDSGELEQLMQIAHAAEERAQKGWWESFISSIRNKSTK